jgi:hypothetical protein
VTEAEFLFAMQIGSAVMGAACADPQGGAILELDDALPRRVQMTTCRDRVLEDALSG